MIKQIEYLHLDDVERFFKPDEVKASIIDALRSQDDESQRGQPVNME